MMRHRATKSRQAVSNKLHNSSIDDAINKFDHYEKKIELMEGEIEANQIGSSGIAAQFDALEKEDKIDEELEALKSRLKNKK